MRGSRPRPLDDGAVYVLLIPYGAGSCQRASEEGEPVMGIEPTPQAWEARLLPLQHTGDAPV